MSVKQEFGPSDLRPPGISTFSGMHRCNGLCNSNWLKPKDTKIYFEVKQGSSMTLKPILKKRPAPEPIQEEPEQLQCIVVFTDGACKNNGASRALAGIGVAWPYEKGHNYWGRLQGPQTNNRAEYKAVITALRIADKIDQSKLKPIYIFTDSNLVVQSMTEWLPGWKRNDWRKSDGGEIMNLDLVKELAGLIESRKVIFKHVRAHTGRDDWVSRWNAEADGFASRGC